MIAALKRFLTSEPLIVRAVIGFALAAGIGWGLHIDTGTKATIIAAVSSWVLAWARAKVTPVALLPPAPAPVPPAPAVPAPTPVGGTP